MKKLFIILTIVYHAVNAQNIKFAVISNPGITDEKSALTLTTVLNKINEQNAADFIVIMGNLTQNAAETQFNILKTATKNFPGKILFLPGQNDLRDANGWDSLNNMSDANFIYEKPDYAFIALSPVVPLTNLSHFTLENLDWLSTTLDNTKFGKEIYFFSPSLITSGADNWKQLLIRFGNRFPQLIIDGNSIKAILHNQNGFRIFDALAFTSNRKEEPQYTIFELSKDSVKISNANNKVLSIFDKTIQVEKEPADTLSVATFDTQINMRTDLNSTMLATPSYWNNRIYTSDISGLINCIDSTGKILWDYDSNGNIYDKPVIEDRILAVSTLQGDLFTISAISGEQIQSIGFDKTITTDLSVIDYKGAKELMIPKLSKSKAAIVFGTAEGNVLCYDLETLQKYWDNNVAKGMIRSKPYYINNKILYTSRDGFLYCIDARDGILIWRWKEKEETDLSGSQILCDSDKVYVTSEDGILYAINLLLGKLEWKLEKLNILPMISLSGDNKLLYVESRDSKLFLIQTAKGKIEKEINTEEEFNESLDYPIDAGNNILYTSHGFVFSIDKKFNTSKILYLGNAPYHPITKISDNKFLISNIDGRIVIFSMR